MTVLVLIASYIVVFGGGFWVGSKAVRRHDVRQKLAYEIAIDLLDADLPKHIARVFASQEPRQRL